MVNFAPVLIPTLNRHEHFKRCVQSLSECTHADKTDLYISFDFPLKETHWDGYKKIEIYIETISGFRSVNVIKRNYNLGAVKNFYNSLAELFEKYDRVIFSEDDNVFAPSFLKLVNNGLHIYETRSDIFSVSGYNIPITMPSWYLHDAYLATSFVAWGVGIWKDKWNEVDLTLEGFTAMLSKKENMKRLKRNYLRYLPQLQETRDTGVLLADGVLFLHLLDKNMYSVYPVKTRVRNTGHDGSGENCKYSDLYLNQKLYEGTEDVYYPADLQPDKKLLETLLKQIQIPIIQRIRVLIPAPLRLTIRKIFKKH